MERTLVSDRTWVGAFLAVVAALVGGSLAFPRAVYDRFIWQYFWGPIYSDAHSARCAIKTNEGIITRPTDQLCQLAADRGVVAYTGYTTVSEIGYMVTLVFMLLGVLLLVDRLEISQERKLTFALVPFILFGGAFRVVEDATDAAVDAGVAPVIGYPLNTLIISPIIYGTVFVIVLGSLLVSFRLEDSGVVEDAYEAMTAIGTAVLALTLAYLFVLSFTVEYVSLYPQILVVVVGIASALAYGIYVGIDAYAPELHAGTGKLGLVVLWAHAIDGVANVVASDWATALGGPFLYGAKHPVNRVIIDVTEGVLPAGVADAIGTSWPFLVVKMVVAVGIIWVFDEQIFEESPRYALLLVVAAIAVGLGPGTRDVLRVTFGI